MSGYQSSATRHVFDNGLILLVQENHFNQTVAISGRLKAGGMHDSPDLCGCANFAANMLTRGTESRTWEEIAEVTESVGASLGFGGNTETVSIEGLSLAKDVDRVLDVLNDTLRFPTFPEEEIEKHRRQVYSWLKAWEDDTDYVSDRMLREMVYPENHPYHWSVHGTEASVGKLRQDTLSRFHARYYRPDALILAIIGDVDTPEIIEKIQRVMGDWVGGGESQPLSVPPVAYREKAVRIKSLMDKSQVNIALGHKGIPRTNPDCYAFDLMNRILGGSAGLARLFGRVRDVQGLAYSVWSAFTPSLGEGLFYAGAGVNPDNVDRAIDSILHEIDLMKTEGVTEEELSDAQNLVVGNFALTLETNKGVAAVLLLAELFGLGIDYPMRQESIYRGVTQDEVAAAADKYLHPDRCCVAIAGPYHSQ